jgi:hypothetical protein
VDRVVSPQPELLGELSCLAVEQTVYPDQQQLAMQRLERPDSLLVALRRPNVGCAARH